jgi:phosphoribosylanthranilate isomerase
MALKTFVKVGNISNLSDARYCAGMGVEMLGFDVEKTVSPESYKEMIGWLSGVKFVAEFAEADLEQMNDILQNYPVHALQIEREDVLQQIAIKAFQLEKLPIDLLFKSEKPEKIEDLAQKHPKLVRFFILGQAHTQSLETIQKIAKQCSLLIEGDFNEIEINRLLEESAIAGIALRGSAEIAPGLKDFDDLALILENLETD